MATQPVDMVNDAIKDYIMDLHQATRFSVVQSEVDALYGTKFQELSKAYYGDKTPWPSPETIAPLTSTGKESDTFFLCFYKEMTDRQLAASKHTSAQAKVDAWANYCALFDTVVAAQDCALTISEQWAFDVVHEFVYSFQGFCQFRSDLSRRDAADLEVLRANPGAWNLGAVAGYLKRLVGVGSVDAVLAACKAAGAPAGGLDFRKPLPGGVRVASKLHFDLGYFALVGLSRLECLLGDYRGSLDVLAPIDFGSSSEYYQKVFPCYLNLYYHAGVSFLMLRRAKDAVRTLGHLVQHVNRLHKTGALFAVAPSHTGEAQQAVKTCERAAALLACAVALCPGAKADDVVGGMQKEQARLFAERLATLEADGEGADFEAVFEKACPKFVSGAFPPLPPAAAAAAAAAEGGDGSGALVNLSHEPVQRQVELFGKQVCGAQQGLGQLRSFLKLYTSIDVSKLAKFQDGASPETVRAQLLSAKRLMTQDEVVDPSAGLGGEARPALDVHFFLEGGSLVHVDGAPAGNPSAEAATAGRHTAFFMDEILRAEAVCGQVKAAEARHQADKAAALVNNGKGGGYGDDYD